MNPRILALFALALLSACASKPSGRIEDVMEAKATITAVDPAQRHITLKTADGQEMTVKAAEAVKNLDRVQPGDEVVVSYTKALAWQVKPASAGAPGVSENKAITTAQPGAKPGGSVGVTTTITATITAIDLAGNTFTLTGPAGRSETMVARDPENLKKVKVGDLVDIAYSEAVALAVRPAAPAPK